MLSFIVDHWVGVAVFILALRWFLGGPTPSDNARDERQDTQDSRMDRLCADILDTISEGPEVLRQVAIHPERAVEGVRTSYRKLGEQLERLRGLRPQRRLRQAQDKAERIKAKLREEKNALVRGKLKAALQAAAEEELFLSELVSHLRQVQADRLRLYQEMSRLHAQLLHATSTAEVEPEEARGVQESLERLSEEVSAVTQALEEISTEPEPHRARSRTRER